MDSTTIAIIVYASSLVIAFLFFRSKKWHISVRNGHISIGFLGFHLEINKPNPNRSYEERSAELELSISTSTHKLIEEFEERIRARMAEISTELMQNSSELVNSAIYNSISEKFGDETIKYLNEEIERRASDEYRWSTLCKDIEKIFQAMSARSIRYADSTSRHAEFYRINAVILSIFGIITLTIFIAAGYIDNTNAKLLDQNHVDFAVFLMRNGPQFSLVVLIEYLAFLMFRNSMRSLEYMRYFSNESSNIDARQSAFLAAARIRNGDEISKIISNMLVFERNKILKSGEKSHEIEISKQEDNFMSNYSANIKGPFSFFDRVRK